MAETVVTGALALIKVGGLVVGKARNIRATENLTRVRVVGLGTIIASEAAVTAWAGSVTCDFMSFDLSVDGVPNAIRRIFPNILSQVLTGGTSFEDQLVLDVTGVQIDIFRKAKDMTDAQGNILPKLLPYATIANCMITSDGFDISEGSIAGRNQSFDYLTPITFLKSNS